MGGRFVMPHYGIVVIQNNALIAFSEPRLNFHDSLVRLSQKLCALLGVDLLPRGLPLRPKPRIKIH